MSDHIPSLIVLWGVLNIIITSTWGLVILSMLERRK